jgi:SAM-dependent methyltransferase
MPGHFSPVLFFGKGMIVAAERLVAPPDAGGIPNCASCLSRKTILFFTAIRRQEEMESMEVYKRKTGYQNQGVAEIYLERRFGHPRGRRQNEETKIALERALNSISGAKTILDMPCGSGRLTQFFYDRDYTYFGADISLEMMNVLAREQKARNITPSLVRCDGEALPFKDNAFDCVVCFRFLNHSIPKGVRDNVFREMKRVSRKWLILQSQHLRSLGPFVRLKVFARKAFGGEVAKYQFEKEVRRAGWKEEKRLWIRTLNRYIGVYQKTEPAGRSE